MKNKRFRIDPKKQIGAKSNTPFFIFVSFAAILSMVVLGYLKLSDYGGNALVGVGQKKQTERTAATVTPTPPLKERMKKQVLDALPNGGAGLVSPAAVSELYGRWYTNIPPNGIAEFTFKTGEYELIYVDSPQSRVRKFSVGKYNYDPRTGYLELLPERNAVPSEHYESIRYKIITARNFKMLLLRKPGDMALYMTAHENDLAGKSYHPLFMYESINHVPVLEFMPVVANKK